MQGMVEDECSRNAADATASTRDLPRELTHDEKKAAEAAFRGEPSTLHGLTPRQECMRVLFKRDTNVILNWCRTQSSTSSVP